MLDKSAPWVLCTNIPANHQDDYDGWPDIVMQMWCPPCPPVLLLIIVRTFILSCPGPCISLVLHQLNPAWHPTTAYF